MRVEREDLRTGECVHTSTAYLTMVAVDDQRRPAPVPPAVPQGPAQERRRREADLRRSNRLGGREAIARARGEPSGEG